MLVLHKGGSLVTQEELAMVPTPEPTQTHFPISHVQLLQTVKSVLTDGNGIVCEREEHALAKDGQRYFGVMQLRADGEQQGGRAMCVGVRNSHDKTFSAGLVLGNRVFCCDNLSFSGEVTLSRKHTRFIADDLYRLTAKAVSRLLAGGRAQSQRFGLYEQVTLDDRDASHLVMKALSAKAVTTTKVVDVWEQWLKPSHEEFSPRNAWSLFNAFTEVYKADSLDMVRKRSQLLQGTFDAHIGLTLAT